MWPKIIFKTVQEFPTVSLDFTVILYLKIQYPKLFQVQFLFTSGSDSEGYLNFCVRSTQLPNLNTIKVKSRRNPRKLEEKNNKKNNESEIQQYFRTLKLVITKTVIYTSTTQQNMTEKQLVLEPALSAR